MVPCVICGKPVDEKKWVQTGGDIAKIDEQTFYFCGLQHKMRFMANPSLYLSKEKSDIT